MDFLRWPRSHSILATEFTEIPEIVTTDGNCPLCPRWALWLICLAPRQLARRTKLRPAGDRQMAGKPATLFILRSTVSKACGLSRDVDADVLPPGRQEPTEDGARRALPHRLAVDAYHRQDAD